MSADDQALSIGKTVMEYVASKSRLAAIRAEISRAVERLETAATALRERPDERGVVNEFSGMPTLESLHKLTSDLRTETHRHEELLKSIKAIGLEA